MLPPLSCPQSPCGTQLVRPGSGWAPLGPRWGWGCHEPSPCPAAAQGLWSLSSLVETTPGASAEASVCPEGSGQGQQGPQLRKGSRVPFTLLRAAVSSPALCPGPHRHSREEPWLTALALQPETVPKAGQPGLHGGWAPVQGQGGAGRPGPWGWGPGEEPRTLGTSCPPPPAPCPQVSWA